MAPQVAQDDLGERMLAALSACFQRGCTKACPQFLHTLHLLLCSLLCGAFSPGFTLACCAACAFFRALCASVLLSCFESALPSCSPSWPSQLRCRVFVATHTSPCCTAHLTRVVNACL